MFLSGVWDTSDYPSLLSAPSLSLSGVKASVCGGQSEFLPDQRLIPPEAGQGSSRVSTWGTWPALRSPVLLVQLKIKALMSLLSVLCDSWQL